jgi:hypothetical protein
MSGAAELTAVLAGTHPDRRAAGRCCFGREVGFMLIATMTPIGTGSAITAPPPGARPDGPVYGAVA